MVACYNEEDNLLGTLNTLRAALGRFDFSWEIIIVDDASTDGSAAVAEQYLANNNGVPVRLVTNVTNQGLAQSYITGAFLGRGQYYRLICGDNVEPEDTFVQIFQHIGEADIVVPYHVSTGNRTWLRRALSWVYTWLVNGISGNQLSYYNGLAVLRRGDVMRWHTNYHGFGFQADMLTRLLDLGRSYVEIPVAVNERRAGTSSALRLRNFLSVAHTLLDLAIRRLGREIYPDRRCHPRRATPSVAAHLSSDAPIVARTKPPS